MTANNTKGTAAVMNPSESPGRKSKSTIPDKTSPRHKQQVDGVPSNSNTTDQEKQQQERPPERVATNGDGNGDVIGEYALGETIGKGTFGKVKLGLHLLTGEKVAVKILEKKRIVQAADVERVAREIKILKRNRHQNVIQLFEVIDSPDNIFLIMEHVDGGEMFEYIVAHHRIREPEAAFLFRQIVDGLAYLHSNEVTHRDLKPENLLLQSNHKQSSDSTLLVKIVDFGLSNTHDGGRLLRTACGSPCYAAPEMIQGRLYHGPIADMWSLGVVLFAMVCGFLPFEDSNTNMLYKKILSANYKMPTFLSANAQDLIRHILETDPSKRYTVDKIRQHPWLAGVQVPDISGYDSGAVMSDDIKVRHEQVLNQLEALGLSKEEVKSSLSKKAFNRFTASYYLLDSKFQRMMKNRVIPVPTTNSTVRRESNISNSDRKRQDKQSEATVREGGDDVRITSSSSSGGQNTETTETPRRQNSSSRGVQETPRRRSNSHQHPPSQQQQHNESPYARRAATPATPRQPDHKDGSKPAQRPSSVRGGRNLVMINNGPTVHPGGAFLSITPNPPRDHRHSSVLTARKPHSNSRVTVSNGMVALRPIVQPVHPPRRELPQSATRRHSTENPQHPAPPGHMAPVMEPHSHHPITSTNGGVVLRRRPQGPVPPPHHATHTQSPHQAHVVENAVVSSQNAKADDTRSPQRSAAVSTMNL